MLVYGALRLAVGEKVLVISSWKELLGFVHEAFEVSWDLAWPAACPAGALRLVTQWGDRGWCGVRHPTLCVRAPVRAHLVILSVIAGLEVRLLYFLCIYVRRRRV